MRSGTGDGAGTAGGTELLAVRGRGARRPDLDRPFKVPLYPVTPLVFCASSAYMVYRASTYAQELILLGAIPLAIGIPFFFFQKNTGDAAA